MSDIISETAQGAGLLDRGRPILIRKAHLITMDDRIGDLVGDVLVKDGKIVEVGRNLVCEGAAVIDGGVQRRLAPSRPVVRALRETRG